MYKSKEMFYVATEVTVLGTDFRGTEEVWHRLITNINMYIYIILVTKEKMVEHKQEEPRVVQTKRTVLK